MTMCPTCGIEAVDEETGACGYCAETAADRVPAPTTEPAPETPTE